MGIFAFRRYAVSIAAAALLAGCGGPQPPIGAPGATPQNRASQPARRARRFVDVAGSEERGPDLRPCSEKRLYSFVLYRRGESDFYGPPLGGVGLCSDNSGNVFIPGNGEIWGPKHGGTTPISKSKDSGYRGVGCSVDPTTGNLAVANTEASSGSAAGNIAIFTKATGSRSS